METRSAQTQPVSQHINQISKVKADYSHVVLTQEEIDEALHQAKAKKSAAMNMEAYRQRLYATPVYEQFSYEQLDAYIRKNHNVVNADDFEGISKIKEAGNVPYILNEGNTEIYEVLCQYFSNDPSFELGEEYSLKKGILLRGPIGCGKTSLMQMFMVNTFRPFEVISCRVIADQYSKNGSDALYTFAALQPSYAHQNFGHKEIGFCYDDLGTEDNKKNFGNEVNVMQDIIYKLYDIKNFGFFHSTTNLGSADIAEIYGDRIKSRVFEMFNVISFPASAKDWRIG